MAFALMSMGVMAGENDLLWDYTNVAPSSNPDNGLYYASKVNSDGLYGVKLNSSGFAYFTKAAVTGTLTLTFSPRTKGTSVGVSVYTWSGSSPTGETLLETSVELTSTGSVSIPLTASQNNIYITRSTSKEAVLQSIRFTEGDIPVTDNSGYYLIGSMTEWGVINNNNYKFTPNAHTEGEYTLTTALAAGDEFKVIYTSDNEWIWYPAEVQYIVDATHAGDAKTIHFRPDYQGGEDWYEGCIFVPANNTSVDLPEGIIGGICGSSTIWTLDTLSGTLHFSGIGVVSGYNGEWNNYREYIQSIVFSEGITEINGNGQYSFYNNIDANSYYNTLHDIYIPTSMTTIDRYIFGFDIRHAGCIHVSNQEVYSRWVNSYFTRAFSPVTWEIQTYEIDSNTDTLDVRLLQNVTITNIHSQNPNVVFISATSPSTIDAIYDMDGDGTMEFMKLEVAGTGNTSWSLGRVFTYNFNRYSIFGTLQGVENTYTKDFGTTENALNICELYNANNDNKADYLLQGRKFIGNREFEYYTETMSSHNTGYEVTPISCNNINSEYFQLFSLDANLNGRTDLYSYEGAGYYGWGGSHYIHYRQADGSYLKSKLQILVDTTEVDSALHDVWTTGANSGPMVTALENSLSNYMFLPENNDKNPYASIDAAIDIDQNGLIDLLSSTTGAALLNVGNNRFVQCKFPGKTIVKDLNNDNIPDYIMYDSSTKTVSLQTSNADGTISIQTLFQGMVVSEIWCYDFDKDGDVDILLPFDYTQSAGYAYLVFFRNDGNNVFKKIENAFDEPIWSFKFLECKDVDNDGKYEILAVDSVPSYNDNYISSGNSVYKGDYYIIRYNNKFKVSVDEDPFLKNGIKQTSNGSSWNSISYANYIEPIFGDFNNDGIMDYWVVTDYDGYSNPTMSLLSHFTPTTPNTAPSKMSSPTCVLDTTRQMLRVLWDRGNDAECSNMDLEYSIRIGSASGKSDIWFAAARTDGKQRNILGGNVGNHLSQWVNVSDWPIGDYYIAVQAIDPSGMGGAWSDEVVYHHSLISAGFEVSALELTTVDTLVIQYRGVVNPNYTYSWNFGDSAVVVEQNTNTQFYKVLYDYSGFKTVSLQVIDNNGNSAPIETKKILVHGLKIELSDVGLTQTCVDINMDGLMDAIRSDGLYKGKTDGTQAKVPKTWNSDLTFSCFNTGSYRYNYDYAMSFIDYNMDGLPDIAEKTNKGTLLLNEEDYEFSFTQPSIKLQSEDLYPESSGIQEVNVTNNSALQWCDLNNDGWMDVNTSNAEGRASSSSRYASIYYGSENRYLYTGGFKDSYTQNGTTYTRYVGTKAYWNDWQSYFGDFNNDGYEDILTCFTVGAGGQYGPKETYRLYLNYGEDRFVRSDFVLPTDVTQRIDGVADIDNDGYLDMLLLKNDKTILVLLGDEDLSFVNRAELRLPSGYQLPTSAKFPLKNCAHDFDNNGYTDIVTINNGIIYVHPNYQVTVYELPTAFNFDTPVIYPFADLDGDGVPNCNNYSIQTRITNQAPAIPTNLSVTEENGAVKLSWDAAIDNETPAAQMRYNISIKKKNMSVGQENAFIISPMNGLYDEAAIVPDYPYKRGTHMYVPYRRFEVGQEYEFQIQAIDGWNAHSPMSAPMTFTVQKNTTPISSEKTETEETPVKILKDGHVFILRGNKTYTFQGQEVK